MLYGVRATNKSKVKITIRKMNIKGTAKKRGSVSVEAAISLSVFMLFIFSLAYILKVFYTYNTVQESLSEVSRNMANFSYFYHITEAKDFTDRLNDMAQEAGNQLEEQKNTIVNAFTSFTSFFSSDSPADEELAIPVSVDSLIDSMTSRDDSAEGGDLLFAGITPKEELKLFITLIAKKLNYEITNKLVCLLAKNSLKTELSERTNTKDDPALALGICNGMKGLDFSKSSVFGDSESLEFIVNYTVEPFAFLPAIPLSNRVKVIGWTGGRGATVKVSENSDTADDTTDTEVQSYWNSYDDDKRYFDRGFKMKEEYLKSLNPGKSNPFMEFERQTGIPVMDAYVYNKETGTTEYYDVFTLNPFLKTYSTQPGAIASQIKKHGKRLHECETPNKLKDREIGKVRKIVVMIVPENSGEEVDKACQNAQETLKKHGVEVMLHRAFGSYESHDSNLDSAA